MLVCSTLALGWLRSSCYGRAASCVLCYGLWMILLKLRYGYAMGWLLFRYRYAMGWLLSRYGYAEGLLLSCSGPAIHLCWKEFHGQILSCGGSRVLTWLRIISRSSRVMPYQVRPWVWYFGAKMCGTFKAVVHVFSMTKRIQESTYLLFDELAFANRQAVKSGVYCRGA